MDQGTFERFRQGDSEAAEYMVDLYGMQLFHYARLHTFQTETAEDIVQDTFLEAFRSREKARSAETLRAWLFTILRRRLAKEYEKGRTNREFSFGEKAPDSPEPARQGSRILEGQSRKWLEDAVASLPPRDREAVALKYFAGLKIREIADVLRIPQGTIGGILARGLRDIRAWFDERGVQMEDLLND